MSVALMALENKNVLSSLKQQGVCYNTNNNQMCLKREMFKMRYTSVPFKYVK